MSVSTALAELTRCTYRSIDKKGDPTTGPPMNVRQAGTHDVSGISCGARRAASPDQLAALKLSLASAISVSFLSAAFSSSRFRCSTLAQSLRPSCFAQAISVPYRAIS